MFFVSLPDFGVIVVATRFRLIPKRGGMFCPLLGLILLPFCFDDSLYARTRAQEKVFVFSPLSITFLDILHFLVDCKWFKWSDRCVIDGFLSITSITDPSLVKFK